jgi:Nucleotidyl transferase of unknown function (DUF2204)
MPLTVEVAAATGIALATMTSMGDPALHVLDDVDATTFYRKVVEALQSAGVPLLVGGTYALERHAGIQRRTKDLDLFIRHSSFPAAERALQAAGFTVELTHPHWLAKARHGEWQSDLIFASGNGLAKVDEEWFANGVPATVFDIPVLLCPAEETVWSKSFVMERERFDGADVLHILRESAERLDWRRVLRRFGHNAGVLLAHLILFRFVYPSEAHRIPRWVVDAARTQSESGPPAGRLCRGTLLSRAQYRGDLEEWGYQDARLAPYGTMTPEQVALWTLETDDLSRAD